MSTAKESFLSQSSDRIKEERVRLGLSQLEAADLCGVSREQWGKYERGQSVPGGEVLFSFTSIGADGGYILTGIRTPLVVGEGAAHYDPRRAAIIAMVDKLDGDGLEHVQDAAEMAQQLQELKYEVKVLKNERKAG